MSIRVLLVHAAMSGAAEYNVHRTLAENVDPARVTPYFVWQRHTQNPAQDRPARLPRPEQNLFLDFGRDLAVPAKPPRVGRALSMIRRLPAAARRLVRYAKDVRPDLLYTSQQTVDVRLATYLSRRFVIPHVIHLHYPVGPWLGPGMPARIRSTERLVAVSDFIRKQAWAEAGVPESNVAVLHGTIPLDAYRNQGKDEWANDAAAVRAEFGIAPDQPLIVAVGRLDPSKGHELLIQAMRDVRERLPGATLLVCGATFTRDRYDVRLQELAAERGVADRVIFAGMRSDVPRIYAAADVFCLPTVLDACPLVFLEAMAAGLPVVALRSGGVPEMVVDGATGLLSEPGDASALAAHLVRVLSDRSLGAQFGAAGRERVQLEFAPGRAAAKWAEIVARYAGARAA